MQIPRIWRLLETHMTRTPHHSKKEEIRRPRFAAHPGSRGRLFIFWYVQIGRYAPFVHGALEGVRKINCCTRLRHDGIPFSGKRFGNHKNIHNPFTDIFRIHFFRPAGFAGNTRFFHELAIHLVNTHNRVQRVKRTLLDLQNVLHFCYKFRTCFRDAPLLNQPWLKYAFFIVLHAVLSVI